MLRNSLCNRLETRVTAVHGFSQPIAKSCQKCAVHPPAVLLRGTSIQEKRIPESTFRRSLPCLSVPLPRFHVITLMPSFGIRLGVFWRHHKFQITNWHRGTTLVRKMNRTVRFYSYVQ
jgi:hypothetical protein